jgi:hypothetical protein
MTPPVLVVLMRTRPPGLLQDDSDYESTVDLRLLADVLGGITDLGGLIAPLLGKPKGEHELDMTALLA